MLPVPYNNALREGRMEWRRTVTANLPNELYCIQGFRITPHSVHFDTWVGKNAASRIPSLAGYISENRTYGDEVGLFVNEVPVPSWSEE